MIILSDAPPHKSISLAGEAISNQGGFDDSIPLLDMMIVTNHKSVKRRGHMQFLLDYYIGAFEEFLDEKSCCIIRIRRHSSVDKLHC